MKKLFFHTLFIPLEIIPRPVRDSVSNGSRCFAARVTAWGNSLGDLNTPRKFLTGFITWSVSLVIIVSFVIPGSVHADATCRSDVRGYCAKIAETAQVLVPGIEFLQIPILGTNKAGPVLLALYVFAMSLVGISALVMLVMAGFWYLTAGDNTGRMGQAKTWMGNAVFGLVLALLSFLILYTINPNLTNLLDLKLRPVGGMGPNGIGPGGQQGVFTCGCGGPIEYPTSRCIDPVAQVSVCPETCISKNKCPGNKILYACGGECAGHISFPDDPTCGNICPTNNKCARCED